MKTIIFLAEGFETCEALITVDMFRRASLTITTCSITNSTKVKSAHNVVIETDTIIDNINPNDYQCLILPGGMPGTLNLKANKTLASIINKFNKENKLICAVCAAPTILGALGILENKNATCYPGYEKECLNAKMVNQPTVKDGNIITGKSMGTTIEFAANIIKKGIQY